MQRSLSILAAAAIVAGCASHQTAPAPTAGPSAVASRTATVDPKIAMKLDDISPQVTLGQPATQPTTRPSLAAIQAFAQARDELDQNRRYAAINDLEKAIGFDTESPALRKALGEAYLGNDRFNDRSIAAYEKAAALQPDDLDVQLALGRQYLAKDDVPHAMTALRRALLTTGYRKDEDSAALTDFFLATALQKAGYDQAAHDQYASLMERIESPGPDLRSNPELNYLIARPEAIWSAMGALDDRDGRPEEAIKYYQLAVDHDPQNYDLQARIVRLLAVERRPSAKDRAADLVRDFPTRPDAVVLLDEVYRSFGEPNGAIAVLQKLHAERPNDRVLLYALADLLKRADRAGDALSLLTDTATREQYPYELVERIVKLDVARNDWKSGATLLIEASRVRPELVSRYSSLWTRLLGPGVPEYERLTALQSLAVPAQDEPVRWFWISLLSDRSNRAVLAERAEEKSLAGNPLFEPAFSFALSDAIEASGGDSPAVQAVIGKASADSGLSAQLRGMLLLASHKDAEAVDAFRRAIELGASTPNVQGDLADALLRQHRDDEAEKLLHDEIAQHPDYEPAYLQLISFFAERHRDADTVKTLESWITNDPSSTQARLLQARLLIETRQPQEAQPILDALLETNYDTAEVLDGLQALYALQGQLAPYAGRLRAMVAKHPENLELLGGLVSALEALHDNNGAVRAIDDARARLTKDADALYVLSSLYQRLDEKHSTEAALEDALKADPGHAAASNDLGYEWIDAGRNADQAEKLVRTAVDAEPENQAFLDSLGWVLYKRGRFGEAAGYLKRAVAGDRPDPVVLDHLGDTLYRLDQHPDAVAQWQLASDRLAKRSESEENKQLRLQLDAKLKQAKSGGPVSVAPTLDSERRTDASDN